MYKLFYIVIILLVTFNNGSASEIERIFDNKVGDKYKKLTKEEFNILADKGDHIAQYFIGMRHLLKNKGNPDTNNIMEGIRWIEKSSKKGFLPAHSDLGRMYFNGQYNLDIDHKKSAFHLNNTATVDSIDCLLLSLIHLEDQNQQINHIKALRLLEAPICQKQSYSKFTLGYLYYTSNVIGINHKKSAHYIKQAAEAEISDAQLMYAYLWSEGHGVKQDDYNALLWITKSANNGNKKANKLLNKYEKEKFIKYTVKINISEIFNNLF